MDFQHRLNSVIPGGAHTYSRGFDQHPCNAPQILERGSGAYVWSPNQNRYLDYGMALRSVTLGYANTRVNSAAIKEIELGNNLTLPSLTELKAAELLCEIIPNAEMVKFAKNGSNATTAAVKIARAYTGRRYICVPRQQPFFSFDDWFIGTTQLQRGIAVDISNSTLIFDYNDIKSLRDIFCAFPGQIAGVMLEPATHITPCDAECSGQFCSTSKCHDCAHRGKNFLHQVQDLCSSEGAMFILDEMITGFRWALDGAQSFFGVKPDLMTFGKGMANGFSVAAVAGRREVMEVGSINKVGMERTFLLSTTHGGEMCGLGAFIETVQIYKDSNVINHLWDYGRRLSYGMNQISQSVGLADYFSVGGPPICLNYVCKNQDYIVCSKFKTLFMQELVKNGVLMPWISVSLSHGARELEITLSAVESALKVYALAIADGVDKYLVGAEVKPVFRKHN